MPTRQGWLAIVGAVVALVIGRLFAIGELFIIGAALLVAVLAALFVVNVRRPRVEVERHIEAEVLVVGDRGRVTVRIEPIGRSPSFELLEPVGKTNQARLGVGPLQDPGSAAYLVPTSRRGIITVGPMRSVRSDVLGLARHHQLLAGPEELRVAPRAIPVPMPTLGGGRLGQELLVLARRLGLEEFHSLREYVAGDELRSIHWKASARTGELKVRQHSHAGLRRCIVVLDTTVDKDDPGDWFETAVTAAASLVVAADKAGLSVRFVADAVDARGPSVAVSTLEYLAIVEPTHRTPAMTATVERDPGDGMGLVLFLGRDRSAPAFGSVKSVLDPTLRMIALLSDPASAIGPFDLHIPTEAHFVNGWTSLAGSARAAASA